MRRRRRFYCPYCNRDRSGHRQGECPSRDHVIPKNLDGDLLITVCQECNGYAGSRVDLLFQSTGYLYRLAREGVYRHQGVATMDDGSTERVRCAIENESLLLRECRFLDAQKGTRDPRRITSVHFQLEPLRDGGVITAITSKMVVGAAYAACLRAGGGRPSEPHQRFLRGPALADMRARFAPPDFVPGGPFGHGARLVSMLQDEGRAIADRSPCPADGAFHHLRVEVDARSVLRVTAVIAMELHWTIEIPSVDVIIPPWEHWTPLPSVPPGRGSLTWLEKTPGIEVYPSGLHPSLERLLEEERRRKRKRRKRRNRRR